MRVVLCAFVLCAFVCAFVCNPHKHTSLEERSQEAMGVSRTVLAAAMAMVAGMLFGADAKEVTIYNNQLHYDVNGKIMDAQ